MASLSMYLVLSLILIEWSFWRPFLVRKPTTRPGECQGAPCSPAASNTASTHGMHSSCASLSLSPSVYVLSHNAIDSARVSVECRFESINQSTISAGCPHSPQSRYARWVGVSHGRARISHPAMAAMTGSIAPTVLVERLSDVRKAASTRGVHRLPVRALRQDRGRR